MTRNLPQSKGLAHPHSVRDEIARRSRARRETHAALVEAGRRPTVARRNDITPDLRVEIVEVATLRPAARQVRRRDAQQAAKLKASIERYGIVRPLLINGNRQVVDGHGILEAAKALGLQQISCITIEHLTTEEQRALRLALNRLGETGAWDFEELRLEFQELIELGVEVIDTSFELAEIDALLLEDEHEAEAREVLPSGPAVSSMGIVWRLGRHRLIQSDARQPASYERLMSRGEMARLMLTDPPYNVPIARHVTSNTGHQDFMMGSGEMSRSEFAAFLRDAFGTALPYLVDGALIANFVDWRQIDLMIGCGRELGLELLNLIVWAKSNAGQGSLWRSQHELLPVFKKGAAAHVNNVNLGASGRWRSNLWTYPGASSLGSDAREGLEVHPTVKPRAMLEDALLDITNRDDIVIDPFLGSGSTLLAAEATGRICRAIEIEGRYCDAAIRRWQAMTGESATLEWDGESFDAIAAAAAANEEGEP